MNHMKTRFSIAGAFVFALAGLFFFAGCKKEEFDLDPETSYFGLEEGTYVEYDVTYIFHDKALLKHDTVHYQIRTEVADTVHDNSGRVAQKFYRYRREESSDAWELKDLWTGIINGDKAELVEENQRMIKMVFKPTEDKEWDVNAFNNLGEMLAHYSGIGAGKEINGLSFPKTVTVEQQNYTTLIDKTIKFEVYAKGVGMIQKHYQDLDYEFGSLVPIKGEEYYYNVVNYGVQ